MENGGELPEFPDDKHPRRLDWPRKAIGKPSIQTFTLTNDGRFMRNDVYHTLHGSFEFHATGKPADGFDDFYWSYEERLTKGDLDKIVFLGERILYELSPHTVLSYRHLTLSKN